MKPLKEHIEKSFRMVTCELSIEDLFTLKDKH